MALARRRRVRVPASSANLGPGFDSFAAALSLHLELDVSETGGGFELVSELDVPRDRSNLLVRAFEMLHPADGLRFEVRSSIPLVGGLGSSAAAVVAGLMAADHLYELDADVLGLAAELEGHADNAAASVLGGFVVCAPDGGPPHRFDPPVGLEAVLVVPRAAAVPTAAARAALPSSVPLADAAANVAYGALLALGLAGGDWELVGRGLHDRLHEDARGHLFPRSLQLAREASAMGALGATISGAGPCVLVWCQYEMTGGIVEALRGRVAEWATVMRVPFEVQGGYVTALG